MSGEKTFKVKATKMDEYDQGLLQKEKVHIDCENGTQINILASKIATQ